MPAAADVGCNEGCNRHRNRGGLRVAADELDDGRDESRCLHQHPRADDHPRRHRRGDARERRHGLDEARAEPLQARHLGRTAGHARPARPARRRSPTRPAARACWRSTRSSATSRTPSPATRCSSSSTAPTRRWSTTILEAEIDGMAARHEAGAAPFEKAGGFAPTMGIIGTVLGLVHVLAEPGRALDARARRSPPPSSPR